ncbi:cilia- and flagella-associated protein 53 [Phascolarctos cinereus]|uniref:Cilia- and flagella-associated protein 53 n=1 Tax=Phascolarctos cinereus TaxID=38626 RepID=A0A6P5J3N1_PHACI|nr:cilia- and flagella-associated protein 53 isoform X1 [Phascolarctos cinereus]
MERVLQREVKGATPGVVALRAKPPKEQHAEKHLRKIRQNAFKKDAIEASIKENERFHLGVQWDMHIDRSFMNKLVQRKVEDAMQGFLINTEERRKRLRELLEAEENQYLTEIEAKENTAKIRQDEMREKVRVLREAREKERQDFVAKKRDQQFREHCDDLRNHLVQVHEKKVCEERAAQVAFNEELRKQKMIEEKLFIELWEHDRLAKEKRAADEAAEKAKRDEQTLLCLNAQMATLNAQKQEAKRLKEEEGLLVEKRTAQLKRDKEKERLEKQQKMHQTRDNLEKALQDRNDRLAQERAKELYLENKLLEIARQETRDENEELRQKKEDTEREVKLYQAYLNQCWEAERLHEDEADRIIAAESAKIKAKKDAQLMLEKDARKRLMDDVLATRQLQVIEKMEREAKEKVLDQELIMKGLEELNCEDAENYARKCRETLEYRKQLQAQIEHQHQIREAEKEAEKKEYEAGLMAKKELNERIQEVLAKYEADQEYIHPFRRTIPKAYPFP